MTKEPSCKDEARIGQKNKVTRRWAKRGTRPSAPHDQRTSSAYIFGAICPAEGKGAGLVLVLLARTAKSFEDALVRALPEDGEAREAFRMRIENTLFVQLLVGGRLEREGINAKLLSLMALISLALAPVALLLMFEVKFLPYHSEAITWLHRGLLLVDRARVDALAGLSKRLGRSLMAKGE